MGTKSDACDASYLPRQPIRPAGELAGRCGDELVISINDRDLLQSITIYYKRQDNNRSAERRGPGDFAECRGAGGIRRVPRAEVGSDEIWGRSTSPTLGLGEVGRLSAPGRTTFSLIGNCVFSHEMGF